MDLVRKFGSPKVGKIESQEDELHELLFGGPDSRPTYGLSVLRTFGLHRKSESQEDELHELLFGGPDSCPTFGLTDFRTTP